MQSWFWPVAILILLPWIGLLYTPDRSGFGIDFATKTYYWLYAFVVAGIPFTRFSPERLMQAFFIGLAINALVAILQILGIIPKLNPVAYGLGLGSSTMAVFLPLGILMASYYFRDTNEKRKRIVYGLLMGTYFFHLISLVGRAGFLTFFVVSPLILRNLFGRLKPLKISLVYVCLVGIMLLSPSVWERIHRSIDQIKYHFNADSKLALGEGYNDEEIRLYMWGGALQIFLENPILGIGTGGYPITLHERGDPDWPIVAHPHSDLLYMAASFGIIGIFAFLWFFWELVRNAWKERDTPLGFFIFSAAIVFLISGLATSEIVDAQTGFLLALVAGLQNGLMKFSGVIIHNHPEVQTILPMNKVDEA